MQLNFKKKKKKRAFPLIVQTSVLETFCFPFAGEKCGKCEECKRWAGKRDQECCGVDDRETGVPAEEQTPHVDGYVIYCGKEKFFRPSRRKGSGPDESLCRRSRCHHCRWCWFHPQGQHQTCPLCCTSFQLLPTQVHWSGNVARPRCWCSALVSSRLEEITWLKMTAFLGGEWLWMTPMNSSRLHHSLLLCLLHITAILPQVKETNWRRKRNCWSQFCQTSVTRNKHRRRMRWLPSQKSWWRCFNRFTRSRWYLSWRLLFLQIFQGICFPRKGYASAKNKKFRYVLCRVVLWLRWSHDSHVRNRLSQRGNADLLCLFNCWVTLFQRDRPAVRLEHVCDEQLQYPAAESRTRVQSASPCVWAQLETQSVPRKSMHFSQGTTVKLAACDLFAYETTTIWRGS